MNQIYSNEAGAKLLSFNSREKVPSKCSSHQFLSSLDKINQTFLSKVGANFQSCDSSQKKVRPKCSSYHTENNLIFLENINQIILSNFWAKL